MPLAAGDSSGDIRQPRLGIFPRRCQSPGDRDREARRSERLFIDDDINCFRCIGITIRDTLEHVIPVPCEVRTLVIGIDRHPLKVHDRSDAEVERDGFIGPQCLGREPIRFRACES